MAIRRGGKYYNEWPGNEIDMLAMGLVAVEERCARLEEIVDRQVREIRELRSRMFRMDEGER